MARSKFSKLDSTQRKEFGKYWLDISKIAFASLVIKLFEPGVPPLSIESVGTLLLGLTMGLLTAMLGLRFTKEARK